MKNKVAVITGGSSGIGEALAYKFFRRILMLLSPELIRIGLIMFYQK